MPIGSPIGNFDQPILPILDPVHFGAVRSSIESAFSSSQVAGFLKSVERNGVRVRHFEDVLAKGLLGKSTQADYAQLSNGDQGQIREFYLGRLEQVPGDLRKKFFKLYAYY